MTGHIGSFRRIFLILSRRACLEDGVASVPWLLGSSIRLVVVRVPEEANVDVKIKADTGLAKL